MPNTTEHGQIIIDAAAARNNKSFPAGAFAAGSFGPNTDESKPGEYSAVLTGDSITIEGDVVVTYDRLDLNEVLAAAGIDALAIRTDGTTGSQIAALVREELGVNLLDSDLVDDAFVQPESVTLTSVAVAGDSKLYRGQLDVQLAPRHPLRDGTSLVNVGREPLYPVEAIVPTVVEEAVDLPPEALKENGDMLHGNGNPGGNFVTASNGELSISMGARVYRVAVDLPVPSGNEYVYEIDETQDWNFLFSFSMAGAPAGKTLIDMYDIEMTWLQQSTGNQIRWTLQEQEGLMVLVSEDDNMVILDNTISPDGTVLQNIQRMRHYIVNQDVPYFEADSVNEAGALLGDFSFSVSAYRKNSLVDDLNAMISVTVMPVVPEEEEAPE